MVSYDVSNVDVTCIQVIVVSSAGTDQSYYDVIRRQFAIVENALADVPANDRCQPYRRHTLTPSSGRRDHSNLSVRHVPDVARITNMAVGAFPLPVCMAAVWSVARSIANMTTRDSIDSSASE